jgi:hypothetical protein
LKILFKGYQKLFDLKDYISKWTYKRLLQSAVGIYFVWNYFEDGSKFSLFFGGLMLVQALLNVGCFSSKGCSTPDQNTDDSEAFAKDIKKVKLK